MLQARGLKKRFGGRAAVDGVDLDLAPGACFGLVGPNGAGKTTTISMVVGVVPPDEGTVAMDGAAVRPTDGAFKRRIGYVPQDLALYDDLTAAENLRFFGSLYDLDGPRLRARVDAALGIANLADRANERAGTFSGGMKRRLNLAVALLHDPDVVVLDEPTVGIDPQSRNAIFDALERLRAEGKALLYTTHYMEEVERLCDRIAVMDGGRIVASGTLAELRGTLPGQRIRFDLEGDPAEADTVLRTIPGASREGSALIIEVDSAEAALPGLLSALSAHGVRFGGLTTDRPGLEEVFLRITGRSLRDS